MYPLMRTQIRGEYVSILSKIYASHFRTYLGSMEKMQAPVAGQADLLGLAGEAGGGPAVNVLSLFKKDAGAPRTTRVRVCVCVCVGGCALAPYMAGVWLYTFFLREASDGWEERRVASTHATPCASLQEHVFELGERGGVLEQLDKPAIIPHMADYEGKKFPYEVIFRWGVQRFNWDLQSGGCGEAQAGQAPRDDLVYTHQSPASFPGAGTCLR